MLGYCYVVTKMIVGLLLCCCIVAKVRLVGNELLECSGWFLNNVVTKTF